MLLKANAVFPGGYATSSQGDLNSNTKISIPMRQKELFYRETTLSFPEVCVSMKKILSILCILSILVPLILGTCAQGHLQGRLDTPDWPDGTFQGTWKTKTSNGTFQGLIEQGRRNTLGTFSATWSTNTSCSGIYLGPILIGRWDTNTSQTFIGMYLANAASMTGLLFDKSQGLIRFHAGYNASFLPALTGTYAIGAISFQVNDTDRPEYFTPDPNDTRTFMVNLWYPLDPNATGTQEYYMDPATFLWLKNQSPIPLFTIPNTGYRFVHPHAQASQDIAPGLHPVLIFSPGYDGVYQIYTSLIEDLVSHGFVIAAINHPYVSGVTVFPDGHTIDIATPPTDPVEQEAFMNMSLRSIVEDAKTTLDVVTEMNETDHAFAGSFDLGRVGIFGHSFGGGNTGVCLMEDARFKAGLTLDGFFNTGFLNGTITQPLCMMVQEARYGNDTNTQYVWNHAVSDTYVVGINGSTHYAFTDVGVLLSHLVPIIPPKILGFGTIPPKRMVNITRTFEVTFFEVYLNGRPRQDLIDLTTTFHEAMMDYKLGS
jgi:hypothetical protein